jgi:hypothetical protein
MKGNEDPRATTIRDAAESIAQAKQFIAADRSAEFRRMAPAGQQMVDSDKGRRD